MTKREEHARQLMEFDQPYRILGAVAGMDEAGRGPLAGKVVTACVIMPEEPLLPWIDDSKKLSESRRERVYDEIMTYALAVGIGEIDEDGNNNVSRMGSRLTGPGGFIDITRATPKVIFAGNLVGKAKLKLGDGKIEVLEEGSIRKFVEKVGQITFAGQYAPENQEVLFITERAVFRLVDHQMTLTEIAPGIDLQKDILDQIGFTPVISPDLKVMDPGIFCENWGGLGEYLQ